MIIIKLTEPFYEKICETNLPTLNLLPCESLLILSIQKYAKVENYIDNSNRTLIGDLLDAELLEARLEAKSMNLSYQMFTNI